MRQFSESGPCAVEAWKYQTTSFGSHEGITNSCLTSGRGHTSHSSRYFCTAAGTKVSDWLRATVAVAAHLQYSKLNTSIQCAKNHNLNMY